MCRYLFTEITPTVTWQLGSVSTHTQTHAHTPDAQQVKVKGGSGADSQTYGLRMGEDYQCHLDFLQPHVHTNINTCNPSESAKQTKYSFKQHSQTMTIF